ncbi:hypothetical protein PHYBOEH_010549 [Phytophthora boehmeriae]|uniref:Uncharacterized protein n=1 Tax=Phytophthora boehmeriae TaxID=109152 RepID=A0A8T1VLW0_9STRA|nr:hypothetical protein PHYBOEH_010549 [Phytophthora boehmeriae]
MATSFSENPSKYANEVKDVLKNDLKSAKAAHKVQRSNFRGPLLIAAGVGAVAWYMTSKKPERKEVTSDDFKPSNLTK